MKRKLVLRLITIFTLISITALFLIIKPKTDSENQLSRYKNAIHIFYLYADYSSYEETNDPRDIKIEPSGVTESIVERWRTLTEVYPEAGFPEEVIAQEDWLEAGDIYLETNGDRSKLVSDIGDSFPEDSSKPPARSFNDYIQSGEVFYEDLKELMIKEGLEINK